MAGIGYVYYLKNQYTESFELLKTSLNIRGNNNPELLKTIGLCYHKLGQYQESNEYFSKALKQLDDKTDNIHIAKLHNNITINCQSIKDYNCKLAHNNKLLQITQNLYYLAIAEQKLLLADMYAQALREVGAAHFWLNNYQSAVEKFNLSLSIRKTLSTLDDYQANLIMLFKDLESSYSNLANHERCLYFA